MILSGKDFVVNEINQLNFKPKYSFKDLVKNMIEEDLFLAEKELNNKSVCLIASGSNVDKKLRQDIITNYVN